MIYLASPYSSPDEDTEHFRYEQTRLFVYSAIQCKKTIYSPIVYCHQFALFHGAPRDASSWDAFNTEMMKLAEECWVLQLPGWRSSLGVQAEIAFFEAEGKPVIYV